MIETERGTHFGRIQRLETLVSITVEGSRENVLLERRSFVRACVRENAGAELRADSRSELREREREKKEMRVICLSELSNAGPATAEREGDLIELLAKRPFRGIVESVDDVLCPRQRRRRRRRCRLRTPSSYTT